MISITVRSAHMQQQGPVTQTRLPPTNTYQDFVTDALAHLMSLGTVQYMFTVCLCVFFINITSLYRLDYVSIKQADQQRIML